MKLTVKHHQTSQPGQTLPEQIRGPLILLSH